MKKKSRILYLLCLLCFVFIRPVHVYAFSYTCPVRAPFCCRGEHNSTNCSFCGASLMNHGVKASRIVYDSAGGWLGFVWDADASGHYVANGYTYKLCVDGACYISFESGHDNECRQSDGSWYAGIHKQMSNHIWTDAYHEDGSGAGFLTDGHNTSSYQAWGDVKKVAHTWGSDYAGTTQAATCTSAGRQYYSHKCTTCGYVANNYRSVTLSPKPHTYTKQIVNNNYLCSNATCTSPATYYYACSSCNTKGTTTYSYGGAAGHSWNGGVVTTQPTVYNAGIKTYTCTKDHSHIKTENIPKLKFTVFLGNERLSLNSISDANIYQIYLGDNLLVE